MYSVRLGSAVDPREGRDTSVRRAGSAGIPPASERHRFQRGCVQRADNLPVSAPAALNFSAFGISTFHATGFGASSDFLSSIRSVRPCVSPSSGGGVGVMVICDSSAVANANCVGPMAGRNTAISQQDSRHSTKPLDLPGCQCVDLPCPTRVRWSGVRQKARSLFRSREPCGARSSSVFATTSIRVRATG